MISLITTVIFLLNNAEFIKYRDWFHWFSLVSLAEIRIGGCENLLLHDFNET